MTPLIPEDKQETTAEQDARFIEMLRNSDQTKPASDESDLVRKKLSALLDKI